MKGHFNVSLRLESDTIALTADSLSGHQQMMKLYFNFTSTVQLQL